MYIPRRYEEKDKEKVYAFIRQNSFAILISVYDGLPVGTHIPLQLETTDDGKDILMGHISKGNEQKYSLKDGTRVLAIFPGPHAYISPRWYTELNVPTWDYIAVHVYGAIRLIEGDELYAALSRLVDAHERQMPTPLHMEDIPEKTLHDDLRGVVGFQIAIDEIQAAWKLSQNRDEQSYHQVIQQLEKGNETARAVADEMQKTASHLFPPEAK
jgi:transcriptional regulator